MQIYHMLILLFLFLVATTKVKRYIVIGVTGDGKSTFIKSVFSVLEEVPIGHDYSSKTQEVKFYTSDSLHPYLKGSQVFDTPGFDSTDQLTDEEILGLIEIAYIRDFGHSQENNTGELDGIIVLCYAGHQRIPITKNLAKYMALFTPKLIPSLVAIVNRPAHLPPKDVLQYTDKLVKELQHLVSKSNYEMDIPVVVPVVVLDALIPSEEEVNNFVSALKKLKPYQLANFKEKEQAIKKIYDQLIKDPVNKKIINETEIVHTEVNVTKQVLQRVLKPVTEQVCGQGENINLLVISYSTGMKCKSVTKWLEVDEIVTLVTTQIVPTTNEILREVLKNEEDYYWKIAAQMYQSSFQKQFVKESKKD